MVCYPLESNIEPLFVQVELWGEYYSDSKHSTTELILVNNGLRMDQYHLLLET